jgi:hypothetical protein
VTTEGNNFPHWVRFCGENPEDALRKLLEYFRGKREDHAKMKRDPGVFLSNGKDANP